MESSPRSSSLTFNRFNSPPPARTGGLFVVAVDAIGGSRSESFRLAVVVVGREGVLLADSGL
jgi:hypothetical protein